MAKLLKPKLITTNGSLTLEKFVSKTVGDSDT